MDDAVRERLFGWRHAFDEPLVVAIMAVVAAVLLLASTGIVILSARRRIRPELRSELIRRTLSWALIIPCVGIPILAGAAWTMLLLLLLSLLCFREFARATGFFRERSMSLVVVIGILLVYLSVLDNWYELFVSLPPLSLGILALVAILSDRPKGYLQRVGLAALSFLLFGASMGHLAYMANDPGYRSLVLLVILAVQMDDVFAFCLGKSIGGPKLCPNTSPNKTVSGSLGAIILTTALVWFLTGFVFTAPPLSRHIHRIVLGLLLSIAGQLGDLMMSSVKRDVGVKDMGSILPGHGGFLDRFNSVLIAAPAAFHFVGYFRGFGLREPIRILTGGG